nr:MAG TPA: hypothetical protein [Caudoviricetes sp.]
MGQSQSWEPVPAIIQNRYFETKKGAVPRPGKHMRNLLGNENIGGV